MKVLIPATPSVTANRSRGCRYSKTATLLVQLFLTSRRVSRGCGRDILGRVFGREAHQPLCRHRTASSDFTEASKLLPPGTDYEDLVPKVQRRLHLLWDEIVRVAEALDRYGGLVGVEHIRSVARLTSWLS
jgi:hypothetical protein